MLCPGCSTPLKFKLKGATYEKSQERYRTLNPDDLPLMAYLQVVANEFGYAALLPLYLGENSVGRYNGRGTSVSVPILSDDPSLGRNHCSITISPDGRAEIRDLDSMTGTFVRGIEYLPDTFCELTSGDTITLGATTLIYIPREDYEANC